MSKKSFKKSFLRESTIFTDFGITALYGPLYADGCGWGFVYLFGSVRFISTIKDLKNESNHR